MQPLLPVLLAATVACLTGVVGAQKNRKGVDETPPPKSATESVGGGVASPGTTGVIGETGEGSGFDLPTATDHKPSGALMCRPSVFLRPRRLAPGQRGTLFVVVTLAPGQNIVAIPGAKARLDLKSEASPLVYGKPVLEPPLDHPHIAKYRNKPVYDDTMVFRVPVTVREDAKLQKYAVQGEVELEFHQAGTYKPVGTFTTTLFGSVAIGKPLPNPGVAQSQATVTTGTRDSGANSGGRGSVAADATAANSGTSPDGQVDSASQGTPALDAAEPSTSVEDIEIAVGGTQSVITAVLGGVILLLLVLLLVARRR